MTDFINVRPPIVIVINVSIISFTIIIAVLVFTEISREGILFIENTIVVQIAWAGQIRQDVNVIGVAVVIRIVQRRVSFGTRLVVTKSIAVLVDVLRWIFRKLIRLLASWIITVAIAVLVRPLCGVRWESISIRSKWIITETITVTVSVLCSVIWECVRIRSVGVVSVAITVCIVPLGIVVGEDIILVSVAVFVGISPTKWIGLGLITRTSRGRRFEASLNEAKSLDELNLIAADYESALMWKMLGPHQGLRLERMRTEIEREKFADQLKSLPVIKKDAKPLIAAPSGTSSAPAESVKESETEIGSPDATIEAQKTDEVGYEWYTDSTGKDFYRPTGSGEDWQEFNG